MPSVTFLRPRWTALSANPLDAGWYRAEVVCLTTFLRINSSNSRLAKPVPLSVTTISGSPNLAESDPSSSMTQLEEVEDVQTASIHLECASIACSFLPVDPQNRDGSRAHGLVGHFHGFSGADDCICWHSWQSLTYTSRHYTMPCLSKCQGPSIATHIHIHNGTLDTLCILRMRVRVPRCPSSPLYISLVSRRLHQ